MLNISSIYCVHKIVCFVYFTKDVEDWLGYGKLNLFCHKVSHV